MKTNFISIVESYKDYLPQNIIETDVLNESAKKVLAQIISLHFTLNSVKENGYLFISNDDLRKLVHIQKNKMLLEINNLTNLKYPLIKREVGESRTKGNKSTSSRYYVLWDNLQKPIEKISFLEMVKIYTNNAEISTGTVDVDADVDVDVDVDVETDIELDIDIDKEIDIEKETELEVETDKEIEVEIEKEKPIIKKVEVTKTYTDNNISKNDFERNEKALKEITDDTKTLKNPILEITIEKENSCNTNSFKNIDDGKTFNIEITDDTKTDNNLNNTEPKTNTIMETYTERNIIDKMVENALKNVDTKEERQIKDLETFTKRLKSTSTLHDFKQVQNDIIKWCKQEQVESVPLQENVLRKFQVMNQYFLSAQSKLNTLNEKEDDTKTFKKCYAPRRITYNVNDGKSFNKKIDDDTNTQETSDETIPIKVENIINTYQSRIAEVKNSNTIERLWRDLKDYVIKQNFTPSQQMAVKEKLIEIENLKNERLAEVMAKSFGF